MSTHLHQKKRRAERRHIWKSPWRGSWRRDVEPIFWWSNKRSMHHLPRQQRRVCSCLREVRKDFRDFYIVPFVLFLCNVTTFCPAFFLCIQPNHVTHYALRFFLCIQRDHIVPCVFFVHRPHSALRSFFVHCAYIVPCVFSRS